MRRHRSKYVEVEVDVSDIFDELSDEELIEELQSRRRYVAGGELGPDWLDRLRWFLLQRDTAAALMMVETELWPSRERAAAEVNLMVTAH